MTGGFFHRDILLPRIYLTQGYGPFARFVASVEQRPATRNAIVVG
jgi:hypothetical protein